MSVLVTLKSMQMQNVLACKETSTRGSLVVSSQINHKLATEVKCLQSTLLLLISSSKLFSIYMHLHKLAPEVKCLKSTPLLLIGSSKLFSIYMYVHLNQPMTFEEDQI